MPIGVGVALYLVEYGKASRFANVVRYFVDVMTGVPSVVFGLFVYIVLVVTKVAGTFAGVEGLGRARAADAAGRHALGRGRAQPRAELAARGGARARRAALEGRSSGSSCRRRCPGIVTGSLLAVARAAGETAPLLFTAAFVLGVDARPQPADELAAAADLQRRGPGAGPPRPAGVGRGPDARRRWSSCSR